MFNAVGYSWHAADKAHKCYARQTKHTACILGEPGRELWAQKTTCGGKDALLASLGRQVQAKGSIAGVHCSVHYAGAPIFLHVFKLASGALHVCVSMAFVHTPQHILY